MRYFYVHSISNWPAEKDIIIVGNSFQAINILELVTSCFLLLFESLFLKSNSPETYAFGNINLILSKIFTCFSPKYVPTIEHNGRIVQTYVITLDNLLQ